MYAAGSVNIKLTYKPPTEFIDRYPLTISGWPQSYTVEGNQLRVADIPNGSYALTILYRQRIPALSVSNTTNWLITKNPNAYLFASLVFAYQYLRDDSGKQSMDSALSSVINDLNTQDWSNVAELVMVNC